MLDEPLPLTFDPVSNGEILPPPRTAADLEAERRVRRLAERHAARLGVSRRTFLTGACGMAATLATINQVYGSSGGSYAITPEMLFEPEAARALLAGGEFIFDVQSHHVMPDGSWKDKNPLAAQLFRGFHQLFGKGRNVKDPLQGLSRYYYTKEIFLDSDTTVSVLSAQPAVPAAQPCPLDDAVQTREIIDRMGKSKRLLVHGLVTPNVDPLEAQLDGMQRLAEDAKVAAWKTYTLWGPKQNGWWLDDEMLAIPVWEKARKLGIKIVCTHKGLPLPFLGEGKFERPVDVGRVAKLYPDINFVIYHSGYDPKKVEGPYDPATADRGVDCLIKSLEDHGIKPNGNVYAELGSTWWMLMKKPDQAAHVLGKLLKHVGEDRVVWGTDSIWYGSPQPQIEAFRAFTISDDLREKHGYPALTKEVKAKILGLTSARLYGIDAAAVREALPKDEVEKLKQAYLENPQRSYAVYGPTNRREFLRLLKLHDGMPA
jgi:predicted TIM-barrel fold metal-dependent hydrolase